MKATTVTGSAGVALVIEWLWNSFGGWAAGVVEYPTMTAAAAGGFAAILMAVGARYLDGADD